MKTLPPHPNLQEPEALAGAPADLVARLARRAPDAGQPSRAVLAAALLRVDSEAPRRLGPRTILAWSGWAAAAGLAVLFTMDRPFLAGRPFPGRPAIPDAGVTASGGQSPRPIQTGKQDPGSAPMDPDFLIDPDSPILANRRTTSSLRAIQNLQQLRHDLTKLRATNDARFRGSPGLSRTVVVEMTDPADPREAARLTTLRLSERVADSIAAGVASASKDKLPVEPAGDTATDGTIKKDQSEKDLVLSGGDGSWNGDIVIEKGLPNTGMFNLPEGTQIRHLDFPVDDAANFRGLQDLGSGYFYDQFSDLLWKPTGEGKVYLGEKAPAGFDAETFSPPVIKPQTATTEAPASAPTSAPASAGNTPEIAAAPPVRGYPIFDETTGSGSIILQNLTGAAQGQVYQLWVTDPAAASPVSVGLLPQLDDGAGRIWFDFGGPGVAPSGYLLTSPATGSSRPTGRVILKGP